MAYDERVERDRERIIKKTRDVYDDDMANAVAATMKLEETLADKVRALVAETVANASGHEHASSLAKVATAEALSTCYAEALVEALYASASVRGETVTSADIVQVALHSTLSNVSKYTDDRETRLSGVADQIKSAKA